MAGEDAWTEFILSRLGLALFAALMLTAASGALPLFAPRGERLSLEGAAAGLAARVDAVARSELPVREEFYGEDGLSYEPSPVSVIARSGQLRAVAPLVQRVIPVANGSEAAARLRAGDESGALELLANASGSAMRPPLVIEKLFADSGGGPRRGYVLLYPAASR